MTGQTFKRLFGLGFAAFMLAACTASPYIPEEKFAEASEARLVIVTGSRLPQMVNLNASNPGIATPTSVITMDDIDKTGETSLCRALRRIVPNMVGGPTSQTTSTGSRMILAARC